MTTGIAVNRQSAPSAAASELGAGTAYTLLAALGFAAVSTLTTIAVGERVSLWTVQMWRFVVASVALVTFVGVRNYPRMAWPEALRLMVIGGGGQAVLLGLALSSLRFINVATLGFLFYTYPSWVTLVQTVRGAERLTARRLCALGLSFGGIVVIVLRPAFAAAAKGVPWQGIALALGAAVVYGLYIPAVQWLQKSHPVPVTSAYIKLGTAVCFLFVALGDGSLTVTLTSTAWTTIAVLALFSTVMPGVLFLMGLMRLGPVRTAIISTVEPFLTALLGAVVLRQAITVNTVVGGAMIVVAVVVLQVRRERVA